MADFQYILKTFLLISCFLLTGLVQGQSLQDLERQIEDKEQQIENLEKQISVNNSRRNTAANTSLERQIEGYEQEIQLLLQKIKNLQQGDGGSSNDCELEILSYKKEIAATEAIVDRLETENADLNKEIQRLTMEGGGSAEIERLREKVRKQQEEVNTLKGQIKGYQKRARTSSSTTSSSSSASLAQVSQLERQVARLERDKESLRQQLRNNKQSNKRQPRNNFSEHDFQKQFVGQNATNFLIGYRYTLLPRLNYKEAPSIYQGSERAGTLTSTPDQQTAGHNGYLGIERLWHGRTVGGNIGLSANYGYNNQEDLTYNMVGGQLGGELTILPLRMGLRLSGTGGYLWGAVRNHDMLLDDGTTISNPKMSTMVWGWEAKLRVYISRMAAFTGSIGADYPISMEGQMGFWDTSLKFGVGIDVLIPTTR